MKKYAIDGNVVPENQVIRNISPRTTRLGYLKSIFDFNVPRSLDNIIGEPGPTYGRAQLMVIEQACLDARAVLDKNPSAFFYAHNHGHYEDSELHFEVLKFVYETDAEFQARLQRNADIAAKAAATRAHKKKMKEMKDRILIK